MERLTSRFDTSSWYYGWTVQKARARDGIRDYIDRAQDNVHVVNLSVKVSVFYLTDNVHVVNLSVKVSVFYLTDNVHVVNLSVKVSVLLFCAVKRNQLVAGDEIFNTRETQFFFIHCSAEKVLGFAPCRKKLHWLKRAP